MRQLMLVLGAVVPLFAWAAEPTTPARGATSRTEAPKKVEINFEEDTLEGERRGPDVGYAEGHPRVEPSDLVRVRDGWRGEVMQSSGDL
jgi:hypothetical protein